MPRRDSATHSQAKTGASAITYSGFSDWNQLDGKSKPKSVFSVLFFAKRLRVEPVWS